MYITVLLGSVECGISLKTLKFIYTCTYNGLTPMMQLYYYIATEYICQSSSGNETYSTSTRFNIFGPPCHFELESHDSHMTQYTFKYDWFIR